MSFIENVNEENKKMSAVKLELLRKIKQNKQHNNVLISRGKYENGEIPLSFAQERLWFLEQLVPGNPVYNQGIAFHLRGELRKELLIQCLDQIVQRHESLRTIFGNRNGVPYQSVVKESKVHLQIVDLYSTSIDQQMIEFHQHAQHLCKEPFSMENGSLMRCCLYKMEENFNILLLNIHHILIDGWSLAVFVKELLTLYNAKVAGVQPNLPKLQIQYPDYSVWQKDNLKEVSIQQQLEYWKNHLQEKEEDTTIPVDYKRPYSQNFRGESFKFTIDQQMSDNIKNFASQYHATPFMVFMSLLNILLYWYTGDQDIMIGTPVAGRNRKEFENLIGLFTNTLVISGKISGEMTFIEVLEQIRLTTRKAYQNQEIPFEQLINELKLDRNMNRNPLFQICLAMQNFPLPKQTNDARLSLTLERFEEIRFGTSKFDLWIQILDGENDYLVELEYNSELYKRTTIERFFDNFVALLENCMRDSDNKIKDISYLSAKEHNLIMNVWNDTNQYFADGGLCLHQLIEKQMQLNPDQIATKYQNKTLTYGALKEKTDKLAAYLQKKGVGPDTLTGVYMERSNEMLVALLAVVKAGGAYVPLDPSYPQKRLAYMIEELDEPIIISQERFTEELTSYTERAIFLDSDWSTIDESNLVYQDPDINGDNLAYMIYTSGSTGTPKGVMNTHKAIVNRLLWMQKEYQISQSDIILQKTPYSFDVSVWEFFWPLIAGASIVFAKPDGHKDAAYLTELIQQERVTTIHFVPSMLEVFLEEEGVNKCTSLKNVICSGEALPAAIKNNFLNNLNSDLHNLYGPTEAAVDVTYWKCEKEYENDIIPIGRPVSNTKIYILNNNGLQVPIGVSGEIHIGGIQLARGYYKRADLTERQFVSNPFHKGGKLYKTGDIGKFLEDGNVEYLGRTDFQVKLRGFRIELGEIEKVIEEHVAVKKAVVTVQSKNDHKQLVGYIIPQLDKFTADEVVQASQVDDWKDVFNKAYQEENIYDDDFNIVSWNSSFTGDPFTECEMKEWLDGVVNEIIALHPSRVLEIGCGTGLLLARIAPDCESYIGTDISQEALDYIEVKLVDKHELSHITLLNLGADQIASITKKDVDTVVINSVVQYFPNISYLSGLIKNLVKMIEGKGKIFIGDVRNKCLLKCFHSEVACYQSEEQAYTHDIKVQIDKKVAMEQELVIDPSYFYQIQSQISEITHVEVKMKHSKYQNEMSKYRYDVILYINQASDNELVKTVIWDEDIKKVLEQKLVNGSEKLFAIDKIPNLRLKFLHEIYPVLYSANCPLLMSELMINEQADHLEYVDPYELYLLGSTHGYQVKLIWEKDAGSGFFSAVFVKDELIVDGRNYVLDFEEQYKSGQGESNKMGMYANNPLIDRMEKQLLPELRKTIKSKLPDYMVPSAFMFIEDIPLSANGKLNVKALPPIDIIQSINDFMVAETDIQKLLSKIWAEVLGMNKVSINANFFEIGGDSIHSIRIIARARENGVEIKTQQIFQNQTIAELAEVIEKTNVVKDVVTNSKVNISERDQQIIAQLRQEETIEDVYPILPFQKFMLNKYKKAPEMGQFFVQSMSLSNIDCNSDLSFFKYIWNELGKRHPALRTSFEWEGLDEPIQLVHKDAQVPCIYEDWRGVNKKDREERLNNYLRADSICGIDLKSPNPVRFFVAQMEETMLIALSFSYLCLDGWSFNIIFKEMYECIDMLIQGKSLEFTPTTEYKQCVQAILQQNPSKAQGYWKHKLTEITETTCLSKYIPSNIPGIQVGYARQAMHIDRNITEKLNQLAKINKVTLSSIIQGAWALLQGYFTGKTQIMYGLLLSGRPAGMEGVEQMVGSTLNILPFLVEVQGWRGLGNWFSDIFVQTSEMVENQFISVEQLTELCGISNSQYFYQSYLVFQNATEEIVKSKTTNHYFISKMGFPLRVDVYPEEELNIHMSYYRHIFSDEAINEVMNVLNQILINITLVAGQSELMINELISDEICLSEQKDIAIFYEGDYKLDDIAGQI